MRPSPCALTGGLLLSLGPTLLWRCEEPRSSDSEGKGHHSPARCQPSTPSPTHTHTHTCSQRLSWDVSPPQGPVLGPPVALSTGQPSPRRPVVHLSKNKRLPRHPVLCFCSIQSRSCGGPCYPLEGRICFNPRQGGLPGLWVYQGCWSCRDQLSQQSGVPTLPPEAFPLPQQSGSGPNISAFFTPSAEKKVDSTTTREHKRPSQTCGAEEGAFPH